jgi:hypothetical protein
MMSCWFVGYVVEYGGFWSSTKTTAIHERLIQRCSGSMGCHLSLASATFSLPAIVVTTEVVTSDESSLAGVSALLITCLVYGQGAVSLDASIAIIGDEMPLEQW